MMTNMDMKLLDSIDALELGESVRAWKHAMKAAGWKLFAEREKENAQNNASVLTMAL